VLLMETAPACRSFTDLKRPRSVVPEPQRLEGNSAAAQCSEHPAQSRI